MKERLWAVAAVLLIAVLFVGCPSAGAGGSDDGDDTGSEQTDDAAGDSASDETGSDDDTTDGAGDDTGDDAADDGDSGDDTATEPPTVSVADVLALFLGEEALTEPELGFGLVNPDAAPDTKTITVENTGTEPYALSSASSSNSVFPLSTPELPFTLDPGGTIDVSLSFDPTDSGEQSSTVSFTVDGAEGTLSLTATGEGNYPPAARGVVEVSGAGTAGANGTYYRAGTQGTYEVGQDVYEIPYYEHADGGYYIWGTFGEVLTWYIDEDLQYEPNLQNTALYSISGDEAYIPPSTVTGAQVFWQLEEEGSDPVPTVVNELGPNVGRTVEVGTELEANYQYTDAESDAEGDTVFEWYRAGAIADPEEDYELIQSGTDSSYVIATDDDGSYITVVVRPIASTGVTEGDGVRLGPSPFVPIDFALDPDDPIGPIDPEF